MAEWDMLSLFNRKVLPPYLPDRSWLFSSQACLWHHRWRWHVKESSINILGQGLVEKSFLINVPLIHHKERGQEQSLTPMEGASNRSSPPLELFLAENDQAWQLRTACGSVPSFPRVFRDQDIGHRFDALLLPFWSSFMDIPSTRAFRGRKADNGESYRDADHLMDSYCQAVQVFAFPGLNKSRGKISITFPYGERNITEGITMFHHFPEDCGRIINSSFTRCYRWRRSRKSFSVCLNERCTPRPLL